ncbi:hypothetical protein RRG08_041436 [Elysia crispata]|uniref:Uncharacterized protein n=1 Tax=Elysia crispata TaxID=231223 RepID=A0AAE1CIT9_9GAST|nr:hypothetical protein RRG08_041436 [Elysia crispata]
MAWCTVRRSKCVRSTSSGTAWWTVRVCAIGKSVYVAQARGRRGGLCVFFAIGQSVYVAQARGRRGGLCVFVQSHKLGDGVVDCVGPEGPLDETLGTLERGALRGILLHRVGAQVCLPEGQAVGVDWVPKYAPSLGMQRFRVSRGARMIDFSHINASLVMSAICDLKLSNLLDLRLSNSCLTNVLDSHVCFPRLSKLDLSYNLFLNISAKGPNLWPIYCGAAGLESLNFSFNAHLKFFDAFTIFSNYNLMILDLSHTALTIFPSLTDSSLSLTHLNLSYTRIVQLGVLLSLLGSSPGNWRSLISAATKLRKFTPRPLKD